MGFLSKNDAHDQIVELRKTDELRVFDRMVLRIDQSTLTVASISNIRIKSSTISGPLPDTSSLNINPGLFIPYEVMPSIT